jgi:MinD-like ATPase involved in chromosome partitioning or flagellar assembly
MAKIVSVHSFRGGTGKSNLTANLAAAAAARGKRVGIVDTDIQSPGIHVLFGMDEERMTRSLNDYLWGRCSVEEAAYDVSSTLTNGRAGAAAAGGAIYLIPSSIKAGEIARVLREGYDVERLNDGFHDLVSRLKLDVLFIDTHPGLNEETLLSMTISDVLVIVMRPDQQDYQGTAVTVEVARKLDVPTLLLVVNKSIPSVPPEALRQKVSETYGAPVAGVLPHSDSLMALGSADVFGLRYPDDPWTAELAKIADQLAV